MNCLTLWFLTDVRNLNCTGTVDSSRIFLDFINFPDIPEISRNSEILGISHELSNSVVSQLMYKIQIALEPLTRPGYFWTSYIFRIFTGIFPEFP